MSVMGECCRGAIKNAKGRKMKKAFCSACHTGWQIGKNGNWKQSITKPRKHR